MRGRGSSVVIQARAAVVGAALACSPEAPAPAATTDEPAPPALTAVELRHLVMTRQYDAIVAAGPQLAAARERGDTLAQCWAVEDPYLQALLHVAPADAVVARWRADSAEFATVIPPHYVFSLTAQARHVDPTLELSRRLMAETDAALAGRIVELMKGLLLEADIYGHPEGFPRAWLAPDERPAHWDDSER